MYLNTGQMYVTLCIFENVKKFEGTKAVEFDGYMIELWTTLEQKLNFT
jgi:hypothetical protein